MNFWTDLTLDKRALSALALVSAAAAGKNWKKSVCNYNYIKAAIFTFQIALISSIFLNLIFVFKIYSGKMTSRWFYLNDCDEKFHFYDAGLFVPFELLGSTIQISKAHGCGWPNHIAMWTLWTGWKRRLTPRWVAFPWCLGLRGTIILLSPLAISNRFL